MNGREWGDVVGLLAILAFAIGINVPVVLQWRGRLRSSDPDAFGARMYLLFPITVAFLVISVTLPIAYLDPAWLPEAVVAGALLVSFVVGLFGVVLNVWRPRWLRPAWQRETTADDHRREHGAAGTDGAGRYELEMVVGETARLLPFDFDDLGSAERAAQVELAPMAGRGTPAHVAIIDRRLDRAAVRIVEAPLTHRPDP